MSQMENPGLKHHGAKLPVPHTLNVDPYRNPVEPYAQTTRQDIETPPPATGVSTPAPASAVNGAPGMKSQEAALEEQNRHAQQAQIDRAKMPGAGSTATNPAWTRAHDSVQEKMQKRRMSALHREATQNEEYDSYGDDEITPEERDNMKAVAAAGWDRDMHDEHDMSGFEHQFEPDPQAGHGPLIHDVDPRSPQYDTDYWRGWNASTEYEDNEGQYQMGMRSPLERMDDSNASHAAYDGYMDQATGRRPMHLRAVRRLGLSEPGDLPDEHWDAPHKVASVLAYHDVRDDQGRFAPTGTRRREDMKIKPGKFDQAERELGSRTKALAWDRLRRENPEVAIGPDESYASHYERLKAHERKKDPRKRQHNRIKNHTSMTAYAETDEEFWARQPDVLDTSSAGSGFYRGTGDAAGMDHMPEDEPLPHAYGESDLDDVIPDNLSLREHASLLRSMDWDGDTRYPKYERSLWRNISDSEGNPVGAKEGHVIEHNTTHRGPVLPSDDDPNPHPLRYPFTHTYYPAGESDVNGWTAGHNTAESALRNMRQISLYGEHHPDSQDLLKRYTRVGDDVSYSPHANG